MNTSDVKMGTRQRLIAAMSELLQRKGLQGVGLSDVLAQAQAPKGVLYHHFPGGKTELAISAIRSSVNRIVASIQFLRSTDQNVVQRLRTWLGQAQKRLEKSGFEQGCPLAAVALESTAADQELRQALEEGFGAIRSVLAGMLADAGMTTTDAARFSTLIVSAYEGALLQSRIAGSAKPARDTLDLLLRLIQLEIESPRKRS
jgi:TetR/AcrR family transcriptional repressor of lmrAB and yxaGH operons